ncbi:MAG TPA: IS3 family transposase [Solirubrobacteraceae bacterium]|jgi:hypothetical protein|nr:IS3 family transposase [Solirubrobacteraceae bacterium]
MTSSNGSSGPTRRTSCGSPTSPICGPGRAGSISPRCRGDAYDNAVAESFFATIKKELVHRQTWPSRRDLSSTVFDYIEALYNRQRRHSTLEYLSPEEYENTTITPTKET